LSLFCDLAVMENNPIKAIEIIQILVMGLCI
jgi:hypothetical protein